MNNKDKCPDKRILAMISEYLEDSGEKTTPVSTALPPEELKKRLDLTVNPDGCSLDELYAFIENYLKFSVRTGHKQFFNQLWSGFALPGFLGDLFSSLTNTSMYTYEVAPVATLLESALIQKMGRLAGYTEPDGLFGTGGSNGNLTAMLLARHKIRPEIKAKGFQVEQPLAAFVSDQAHYSFEKAANVLGIGSSHLVRVASDERGRMIPENLKQRLQEAEKAGEKPFFVGATAGTTVKGAFDPCDRIAEIAHEHNLWFHVDGSLGGSVLLSPTHKHLLKGCEKSDSFVWNPHKMMGLPLICSAILVREKGRLHRSMATSHSEYLFHKEDSNLPDIGPKSLQCGRKVDALKLWLSWKYYGDSGYATRIDRFFNLAAYAEDIVQKNPLLELMAPRSSVNVCFRYNSPEIHDLNAFNLRLREQLIKKGKSLVNYSSVGNNLAIRLVILNHEAEKGDIEHFFHNILETAHYLLVNYNMK